MINVLIHDFKNILYLQVKEEMKKRFEFKNYFIN